MELHSFENYINSVPLNDEVFVFSKHKLCKHRFPQTDIFDEDSITRFLCGRQVASILLDREIFEKLPSTTILYMLSRIRGESVRYNKSKIGVLNEYDDCVHISWF